jgi:hypothetical protein
MSWKEALELELEVAVADGLNGGPATPSAAAAAERNMRAVLDRWLAQGRMPGISGYSLKVESGAGLRVDLQFEAIRTPQEVVIDVGRKPGS